MRQTGFYIDANLLVLLVVGSVGKYLISKHRRLRRFSHDDYDTLTGMIAKVDQVFVTPNTLTETSNLLAQHKDPERSLFFRRLRFVIEESEEVVVASKTASRNNSFLRLGLTDAALLEAITEERPLITVDLDLYLAATAKGRQTAMNFTHLQHL